MKHSAWFLVFIIIISNSWGEELTSGIPGIGTIKKITIEGIKNVKEGIVLDKMDLKVGSIFSKEKVKLDINNIYSLELFSDIEIYEEEAIDGIELKVKVKERSLIKDIKYVGNKECSVNDIESETNFKKDIPYSQIKLKRAIEKIIPFYKEKGFYLVSVTYEINEGRDNTVDIIFNIKEGRRMYVDKIAINGTKAFTDKVIKSKMETSEVGFLISGTFKENIFENDLKKIINFYNSEGFINAKVSSFEIKYDEGKEKIFVNINIVEEEQFKVGEIKANINKTFTNEEEKKKEELEIRNIITLKEGDIFNEEVYKMDTEKIKYKYSEKGYIGISISEDKNIDKEKKTISLCLQINEGKVFHINKIRVDGNYKTKDYVIKRELLMKEGEPFDGVKIRRSSERIYNLGFFDDVNINLLPGKDIDESRDLIFVVKERATGQLNLGAGYSTLDGLTGFLQVSENNLFGEGKRITAKWEFGATKRNYELSFLEPYFLGEPVSLGVSIYKLLRAYYTDYKDERTGGNVRIGIPAGENTKFWFTYKYEEVNIFNVIATASPTIKSVEGKNTTSSLTTQWIEDTRDSIFFNTKSGYRYSASFEYAGGILLGNNSFTKYIVDGSWYFKTFWEFVLAIHIGAGYATGFGSTPLVPFYEKFFIGGTDTVRGYNERVLSPQDNGVAVGGDFMAYSNLEYRFPIYGPFMGTLFFDLGRAWNTPLEAKIDNIPTSLGAGLRIMLGGALLIRLDYGYGFDKSLYTPGGQIHFNIGNIF
ncbi:MAG: outer membrane protein assembly factor BamA [Candidatus Firestonebacteria bacterium]